MLYVRFIEESVDGSAVYDLKMPVAPQVNETITLRMKTREELRYRVIAVDYLIDVPGDDGPVTEDLTGVRVVVKPL